MSKTKISWTEHSWNPIVGCTKVSPGCKNCYAESMAVRLASMGLDGYADVTDENGKWSGAIARPKNALLKPFDRKKPTMYFVCSMGDLFHPNVEEWMIDEVFGVMLACAVADNYNHTFQVLTKRPERMREYLSADPAKLMMRWASMIGSLFILADDNLHQFLAYDPEHYVKEFIPLPNVWLGVTAENQAMADERIPHLLSTPAAVRFVSVEPMLGPVNIEEFTYDTERGPWPDAESDTECGLDWVICGCESGPGRRPMNNFWAVDIIEQCKWTGTPVFMKQIQTYDGKVIKDVKEFAERLQVREWPAVMKGGSE